MLHLHGYFNRPDSVVFGLRTYVDIQAHKPTQAVQQAAAAMKTLLLVGFGGGLEDPNLATLRRWMVEVLGDANRRHYRLCRDDEVKELRALHKGEPIVVLGYGPDHGDLASFLSRLVPAGPAAPATPLEPLPPPPLPAPRPAPVPAPSPPSTPPPDQPPRPTPELRGGGRAGAGVRKGPAHARPRSMPRWALAAGALAAVAIGLLVAQAFRSPPGPAAACPVPQELILLTTPAKEATVRQLAVGFGDQSPGACRRASLTVFSARSATAVANALAAGWPTDDLALGPQPAVWLPDTSAEVERVNAQLTGGLQSLGSIATSPVVLAMPTSARSRVGEDRTVPWGTMVEWARRSDPGSRLRIGRPDPTSSTAGLLATIGLDRSAGGSATSFTERHAVEQTIDPVADESTGLCQLGRPGGPARAVLVPEQAMVAYNRGAQLGGSCAPTRPEGGDRLTAVYAADGTPVLDHPFVLLPAAAEVGDRERLARDLFAYVMSEPAQKQLREAGFRDAGRRVGGTVGEQDGVLVHDPPVWARPPTGATLTRELGAWQGARLPARALLAMDVSGSMSEELPGPGGLRITAARQAAARAVDLMGDRDQIGLWRFSQFLDGLRDYQELVPLGPAGTGRRRERVIAALATLKATTRNTGLYDTMDAGVTRLRAGGGDAVEALIVVTDGENDDRGGLSLKAVVDRLEGGDEVLVFLLTFGRARCDAGELGELTRRQELVRCLDADRIGLERAFEQVAATLWGTGRLAAGNAA